MSRVALFPLSQVGVSTMGRTPTVTCVSSMTMAKMDKRALVNLKSTPDYTECRSSLQSLRTLLTSSGLLCSYELLTRMSPKISIRLRHSRYSRSIQHLARLAREASMEREFLLCEDFRRLLDHFNNARPRVQDFCDRVERFANVVMKMAIVSKRLFGLAQVWLDLGQLFNHFVVVSCLSSRICIYARALLVYLYDVYRFLLIAHDNCQHNDKRKDVVRAILLRLNIRLEKSTTEPIKTLPNSSTFTEAPTKLSVTEDIGVPLKREKKDGGKQAGKWKKHSKLRKQQSKFAGVPVKKKSAYKQLKTT